MVKHINTLESITFSGNQVKNASMKVLVGPDEGWTDHVMRVIEVEPNGHTPKHQHPWPHINYFLEGEGTLEIDGIIHQVSKDHYAFVPGNTLHQFKNTSDVTLKFICIVPKQGHIY